MKKLINIFFIVILICMNAYAREVWNQDPDNRTYRATANIAVENLAGNGVPNISGTLHFKMSFDTDGDGIIDEDDVLNYQQESTSFSTDQQGYAFVELFITVPSDWYNGWKNVYVSNISGQINGVDISVVESNDTQSNYCFNIYPSYVVIEDDDQDYVSDPLEIQLAEKFKPVLHKHSFDLQSNLGNMDEVITNSGSSLYCYAIYSGQEEYNGPANPIHVTAPPGYVDFCSFGEQPFKPSSWKIDFPNNIWHNGASSGNRPIYYHVYNTSSTEYYIQYWYFFNCNDIRYQTNNSTWHEGDWEHVSIKLVKNGSNFEPYKVNFYQHYGGHTKNASECWWSSTNVSTYSGIQQGYDESRTHLHIWIAANSHASYNRNDLVYWLIAEAQGVYVFEDYIDNLDYSPLNNDLYFEYDQLEKMGEFTECHYCKHHGDHTWRWHRMPIGNSKEWLAYSGRVGDYWTNPVHPTLSPTSPGMHSEWKTFTDNPSGWGFDISGATIEWTSDVFNGD